MAYDRYDREERDHRWSDHRDHRSDHQRERGHRDDDRSWFERAGEEISSWFGASSSDRDDRDRHDDRHRQQERGMWGSRHERSSPDDDRSHGRDYGRDRQSMRHGARDHDDGRRHRDENRGLFAGGGNSERDYNPSWRQELGGGRRPEERNYDRDRGYRPMAGDYGRSGPASSGRDRAYGGSYDRDHDDRESYGRSQSPWGRDEYRRTSYAGSSDRGDWSDPERGTHSGMGRSAEPRGGNMDPHYGQWRDRHMSDIDRDYDDYRRERQSRFEDDFSGWRQKRGEKRSLLSRVREHMEVVGNDGRHVGTVDKSAGDRLILTKSDPESGGRHHSISCSDVDRIEDNRVILDCSADEARHRWRDEDRSRALFERHDQGEDGPRILNRSFEGTYRR